MERVEGELPKLDQNFDKIELRCLPIEDGASGVVEVPPFPRLD
jgi:hypothetical protein